MLEGLIQPAHLLVLVVVGLFVFGPRRLPELGKGLGDGIRALKAGLDDTLDPSPAAPQDRKTKHSDTNS